MTNLVILLMCLLLISPAHACRFYKDLDFSNVQPEVKASKILYNFVLKEQNMTPEKIEEFANITPQAVSAFEVDLNNDDTNEVIGIVYSTLYWGTARYSLFILQKQQNEYKNLSILVFDLQIKV